jgi:crotonobetainyl-CoA:carnitine CoA-transferase CaiB-like acyl-CoA transferase
MLNGGEVYDFYETSDGGYMSVGSLEPKFFADLCRGLGRPEWAMGGFWRPTCPW